MFFVDKMNFKFENEVRQYILTSEVKRTNFIFMG